MRIIEFLEARVAEDQVVANKGISCDEDHPQYGSYCAPDGRHPNPRLVAECQAKIAIIDVLRRGETTDDDGDMTAELLCYEIATALARLYSSHPDFELGWRI